MKQQDAKPEQALPHDLILETLEYTAEHTPGGFLRRLVR